MSVGSITSINSMSNVQMTRARSTDVKSKNIQNEIKGAQQQMQRVSSKEELSVEEKADARKEQQKRISDLNVELKRHQDELSRSQKREIMLSGLQEAEKPTKDEKQADKVQTDEKRIDEQTTTTIDSDKNAVLSEEETSAAASTSTPAQQAGTQETVVFKNSDGAVILKGEATPNENRGIDADKKQTDETEKESAVKAETKPVNDDEDTNAGLSYKETQKMLSEDASAQQKGVRGTAISRIREGIVLLKGEINQDELHGVNTDRKQSELEKLEETEERAETFPFSTSREGNNPMANMKVSGVQSEAENSAVINFSQVSQQNAEEEQRQQFYVSFAN